MRFFIRTAASKDGTGKGKGKEREGGRAGIPLNGAACVPGTGTASHPPGTLHPEEEAVSLILQNVRH